MKVKELIEILEDMDPEATVLLASQPNWPFEYGLAGVAVRGDFEDGGGDEPTYGLGTAANDVFIVEGQQLRYGSKAAWSAARRH
jgi:hypothetical protein